MYHGSTLPFLIASVLASCLARELTPTTHPDKPVFQHNGKGNPTSNVFAVGTDGTDSGEQGSVAHALGKDGVKAHLKALQDDAKAEWEKNFVLDYSLLNYRKAIAKMTQELIKLIEGIRVDMAYETHTIVQKEVPRVWPTLEMQGVMKKFADLDIKNGEKGPCFKDKNGETKQAVFTYQNFWPTEPLYQKYLESLLKEADHRIMSDGGDAIRPAKQASPQTNTEPVVKGTPVEPVVKKTPVETPAENITGEKDEDALVVDSLTNDEDVHESNETIEELPNCRGVTFRDEHGELWTQPSQGQKFASVSKQLETYYNEQDEEWRKCLTYDGELEIKKVKTTKKGEKVTWRKKKPREGKDERWLRRYYE